MSKYRHVLRTIMHICEFNMHIVVGNLLGMFILILLLCMCLSRNKNKNINNSKSEIPLTSRRTDGGKNGWNWPYTGPYKRPKFKLLSGNSLNLE